MEADREQNAGSSRAGVVARWVDPFVDPTGYVPLTERLVAAARLPRWLVVAVFAIVPVANLLTYGWTEATGGPPAPPLNELLPIRLVNTYLIVLAFAVAREGTRRIQRVLAVEPRRRASGAPWLTWLVPPLVLATALSVTFIGDLLSRGVISGSATEPIALVDLVSGMLINLVVMSAFWTGIVALAAVARLGHERLPGTFPEDRSLGLLPVGRLVLFVFLAYVAAYAPVFAVGTSNVPNFIVAVAVFLLGVAVMLLAVWRVHGAMAAERTRQVALARATYAAAYREAASAPEGAAASRLLAADALLRGAESMHQWPFDDGMQRIAAVVMTGVITGLVVRLVLLALGL